MSNGKKSGDRGKIRHNSWRENEVGWKQEEREEKLEKRYMRHCRENMSRRKNNKNSARRIEMEED